MDHPTLEANKIKQSEMLGIALRSLAKFFMNIDIKIMAVC